MGQRTILGGVGGPAALAVMENLYVRGDDDGLWYSAGLSLDPTFGVYLWATGGPGSLPGGTVNISDRVLGTAYFMRDETDSWHTFIMTPTDPAMFGYVWTDYDQSLTVPSATARRRTARAEDGLYIVDVDGASIHKLGITGGLWAELGQGFPA